MMPFVRAGRSSVQRGAIVAGLAVLLVVAGCGRSPDQGQGPLEHATASPSVKYVGAPDEGQWPTLPGYQRCIPETGCHLTLVYVSFSFYADVRGEPVGMYFHDAGLRECPVPEGPDTSPSATPDPDAPAVCEDGPDAIVTTVPLEHTAAERFWSDYHCGLAVKDWCRVRDE
jgi:hypothetical protein